MEHIEDQTQPLTKEMEKRYAPEEGEETFEEGYTCQCGFKHPEKDVFGGHLMKAGRRDGKGVHKSLGITDKNGTQLYPPYEERTTGQKSETVHKVTSKKREKAKAVPQQARVTEQWEQATSLEVTPRVFRMDFTPTMRLAKVASIREWQWPDISWSDFFDTCLHMFFKEHGITLAGYIVHSEEEEN